MALTLLNLAEARTEVLKHSKTDLTAKEMVAPNLFTLGAVDSEDPAFRRISSPNVIRDLNPLMQERMQQVAYFLSVTTPFGKRIIEIITSYVVGEGFKVTSGDAHAQEVLNKFWNDGINDLDKNVRAWTRELNVFGELCLPVAVNPVDGLVRIGYIDPQEIDTVEYGMMKTAGAAEISIPVAVRLKQRLGEKGPRRLKIIRRDEDPFSPTFGRLTGDCFFAAINKVKGASRGISELFALSDWIDVFDQMVFDFADKTRFLNAFVWHYVLNGADEKEVENFRRKVTKSPPRQGGVQVTNDSVQIQAQTPNLHGSDMSESAHLVKLYGLGGAGLPPWFFADPIDANRSTAIEMQGPTGKKLTDKQNEVLEILEDMMDFVLDQAQEHGLLRDGERPAYRIETPDLMMRDIETGARSLQPVTASLVIAEEQGWIQPATAARAFHICLGQLGVVVDDDEFDRAQMQLLDRQAKQLDRLNPQQALANALKQLPKAQSEVQVQ